MDNGTGGTQMWKRTSLVVLATLALIATGVGLPAMADGAAAPGNDDFSDSIAIGGLPYSNSQSTTDAGMESGEPEPCGVIGATVWYDYTAVETVDVAIDTFGSGYDTVLAVHTGDAVDDLIEVACNDDSGEGLQSLVAFEAVAGETYRIQVGGFDGDTGDLDLQADIVTPPTNDDFDDAIEIPEFPYTNTQSTLFATQEPDEPSPCGGIDSTVWYAYTPTLPGIVIVDTFGSTFDTVLAAYVEDDGNLVNLACNDDTNSLQSQIHFLTTPGTTVYIQAGGFFGDMGDLELNAIGTP